MHTASKKHQPTTVTHLTHSNSNLFHFFVLTWYPQKKQIEFQEKLESTVPKFGVTIATALAMIALSTIDEREASFNRETRSYTVSGTLSWTLPRTHAHCRALTKMSSPRCHECLYSNPRPTSCQLHNERELPATSNHPLHWNFHSTFGEMYHQTLLGAYIFSETQPRNVYC